MIRKILIIFNEFQASIDKFFKCLVPLKRGNLVLYNKEVYLKFYNEEKLLLK